MIYVGNTKYKMYVGSTPRKFQTEKEYFYVFHSATGIIERHKMQNHFNLYELVSEGYIYDGYSFSIGIDDNYIGDYSLALKNGTFEIDYPNIEWVDDKIQDVNFTSYDGTTISKTGRNGSKSMHGNHATYISTEKANDMTPIPGAIYYLIEVDASKYGRFSIVKVGASKDAEGKYNCFAVVAKIATGNQQSLNVYINGVKVENGKTLTSFTCSYYLNGTRKSYTISQSVLGYRFFTLRSDLLYYGAGVTEAFEDNTNYAIRMVWVSIDGMEQDHVLVLHTGNRTDDTLKTANPSEYLELTGTQWIDTGLTFNSVDDFELVFDVAPTRFYNYNPIHCINNGTTNESWIDSSGKYAYRQASVRSNNFALTLNQRVKIRNVYKNGKCDIYIDDTLKQSITCNPVSLENTLWLFHRVAYAELKVYWVYIYKNGELVMGLQPIKSGNNGYFLDYVNDKIIYNSGTGDFVLPSEESNETNESE